MTLLSTTPVVGSSPNPKLRMRVLVTLAQLGGELVLQPSACCPVNQAPQVILRVYPGLFDGTSDPAWPAIGHPEGLAEKALSETPCPSKGGHSPAWTPTTCRPPPGRGLRFTPR